MDKYRLNDVSRILIVFLFLSFEIIEQGEALDCFKCVSIGGNNKACDDPFHNNGSLEFFESPCQGGRKNRDGLFPATACIKLAGVYDETGVTLTIRSCALDSGTLTTDSELIRMSHCGGFYYEDKYVRGCVQSCSDADACNEAGNTTNWLVLTSSSIIIVGWTSISFGYFS
ncbi:uncharacterized protein [Venturia canescens]|uniref:uncharacterized protein n=1 Tax=Venturia canescens TaxID=32260 RepID=UPI001C9D65AE|nr:uncharacterized protein LOC122408109 [Venturia canescens]